MPNYPLELRNPMEFYINLKIKIEITGRIEPEVWKYYQNLIIHTIPGIKVHTLH